MAPSWLPPGYKLRQQFDINIFLERHIPKLYVSIHIYIFDYMYDILQIISTQKYLNVYYEKSSNLIHL